MTKPRHPSLTFSSSVRMTRSPTVMFVYLLSLLFQSEAVWLLWTEIDDYYYIISLLRFSEQTQVFVSLSSLLSEIETQSLSLSEVRERHNLTLEWDWDWDTVWLQLLWMNLQSRGSRVQMLWRKVTQLSSQSSQSSQLTSSFISIWKNKSET